MDGKEDRINGNTGEHFEVEAGDVFTRITILNGEQPVEYTMIRNDLIGKITCAVM